METPATQYRPSLSNPAKYLTYLDYFKEYIACKDFKSLKASLKYVFTHKLPQEDYETNSKMGNFNIRKQTTDFQFINFAYERKVKEYLQKNLDSFDVFIDAGACIGEYCVWLAKLGKKCIAIEPVNFEAVRKNIALNHLEDMIQLFPVGLGNKKERVYFYIPNGLPSSSYMEKDSKNEPNVDILTLDELSEKFNYPAGSRILMKLDVEGMEVELIEGSKAFIQRTPNIQFIYEHFLSDNYRNDKALLNIADFAFRDLDGVNRLAIRR